MTQYGLIGYPLTHSFSPAYFARKFAKENIDAHYEAFPIAQIEDFKTFIKTRSELKGLNITIPYKEAVLPYLDRIDNVAKTIGAVNCIKITDSMTTGYNTDVLGFKHSLIPLLQPQHKKALILGTGGAAQAVAYVLAELGIPYQNVSRNKPGLLHYSALTTSIINEHRLIINTTPLGMYPGVSLYPHIPYEAISHQHLLYDLIYNPEETVFLQKGKALGARIKNGLEMLELQAEASWQIWNS